MFLPHLAVATIVILYPYPLTVNVSDVLLVGEILSPPTFTFISDSSKLKPILNSNLLTIEQTSGRTEHHGKLHVLISAEIREHKLAGQTLLLA